MVVRGYWVRFPDTFKVFSPADPDGVPSIPTRTEVLSGSCNLQSAASGGITNDNEAMGYDYVVFHQVDTAGVVMKAEYEIEVIKQGRTYAGNVKKEFPGQLTKRIWFNETSK